MVSSADLIFVTILTPTERILFVFISHLDPEDAGCIPVLHVTGVLGLAAHLSEGVIVKLAGGSTLRRGKIPRRYSH